MMFLLQLYSSIIYHIIHFIGEGEKVVQDNKEGILCCGIVERGGYGRKPMDCSQWIASKF